MSQVERGTHVEIVIKKLNVEQRGLSANTCAHAFMSDSLNGVFETSPTMNAAAQNSRRSRGKKMCARKMQDIFGRPEGVVCFCVSIDHVRHSRLPFSINLLRLNQIEYILLHKNQSTNEQP